MSGENGDQREVLDFLSQADSLPGAGPVERIDTHISAVFLKGERAYKLKRARRLPYLDFSTLALRRAACEAEIAVNRRTAPDLYLGTGAVTRGPEGGLELDGGGPVVDWLVVMRRFEQDALFDRMAERGALDAEIMAALAEAVARFHKEAEPRPDMGGRAGMDEVIEGNARSFAEVGEGVFDARAVDRLMAASRAALEAVGDLLDARRAAGRVRHCHGDLHLRNICLIDGRPTLFDAIEFSESIAVIDVLYDFAFLLMDLEERGLRALANVAFNRYLALTGDLEGLGALPLFLSCRAAIRAHVSATAAAQRDAAEAKRLRREARVYLEMALAFLAPPRPRLVAIGGISGTGKSTLGRALAPELGPAPGALHLRSDLIRKELAGVAPLTRLDESGYRREMTVRVYEALRRRAETVLRAGHAVVADAVYGDAGERAAIEAAARAARAPFTGIWLEAPVETLEQRIEARQADASDATVAVLHAQLARDPGAIAWRRVDAAGETEATLERVRRLLAG